MSEYACTKCGAVFPVQDGKVFFEAHHGGDEEMHSDDLIYKLKRYLKRYFPRLSFALYRLLNVRVGYNAHSLVRALPHDAFVLNVGSGAKPVDPRVVNVDFMPQPGVDVVANAYALPFKNESADLIICESLLEHLEYPERAIAEMHRVLKRGGSAFIVTPFMFGFHSSPDDFYRWTIPGMRVLLKGFLVEKSGVAVGPTGAFAAIAREWFAMLLSFNSRALYQFWLLVFMALLIPLNIFDYLISRYSFASQVAMEYYFIAKKSDDKR